MAPFQTSVNINPDGGRDGQEVIEVQILPQDENWGENTTAITGNTSDNSQSIEDLSTWPPDEGQGVTYICRRHFATAITLFLCIIAFLSPIVMVILPKLGILGSSELSGLGVQERAALAACGAECRGALAGLACRLAALGAGGWALLFRPPSARVPRAPLARVALLLLLALCTFTHWLFYLAAAESEEDGGEYRAHVASAGALTDTLLCVLVATALVGEVRPLQPAYCIKVIRSPDGISRSFSLGRLSVQSAAVALLARYYTEFPVYNPYLEKIPLSKSQRKAQSSFKFYDVDGANGTSVQSSQSRSVLSASARRRDSAHNERFYEEHEYERRVRKRRARLLTAAEEAFAHVKRVRSCANNNGAARPLEAHEAAQAVFPSLARALQKYLRVTRQQPRHSVDSILGHLARCLARDLSPRAFLEPFLSSTPALPNGRGLQSWALESAAPPTAPIRDGHVFQLRQGDVCLLCTVRCLPPLTISEELPDPATERFVLRLNSETSV